MTYRLSGVLCAMLTLFSFNALAVTIEFDSLEGTGEIEIDPPLYSEQGFDISASTLFTVGGPGGLYLGSAALRNGLNTNALDTTLTASDGSAFNLISIDLAEVNPGNAMVDFRGYFQGGGFIDQTFELDGNTSAFQTETFDGFVNLIRVEWNNDDPFHQFDNIVVETVPVPAAIWLFGSGLLGILGIARKRRVS